MRSIRFLSLLRRFRRDARGTTATVFTLSIIPVMMSVGAAIDYTRVSASAVQLQTAVDAAALAAVQGDSGSASTRAANLIAASMAPTGATVDAPVLRSGEDGRLTVTASATVPTAILSAWISNMRITKSATAAAGGMAISTTTDTSCILTTGENLSISTDVMTFDGSPNVRLAGCSLRSNKSMVCNGGSTGATTYAVGGITGCSNPNPGQPTVPDIYASLASNITTYCGYAANGFQWNVNGALPPATYGRVIYVSRPSYTEIHICGDLTLGGVGALSGAAPTDDTVIVVENGGVVMANDANVTAARTSIVLAGGSGWPVVSWPSGNGNSATLSVSASTATGNPWKGVAVYENPSLNVDMTWRPGANFILDGVFYFPRASFTLNGNMSVGPTGCSKIVAGEFTLNGAVNLAQSAAACGYLQVVQYTWIKNMPKLTQ